MTELGTYTHDLLISGDKGPKTVDVLVSSGDLSRGSVLGRIKQSTPTTGTADGGNTGDGTVTAVTGGPDTKPGTYTIECKVAITNGGTFELTDPNGAFVGTVVIDAGAGGTGVFKSSQLNFTVTDGSTDFAVGDKFTVAVTDGVPDTGTADGGNTGDGTVTEVEGRQDLKKGTYEVECTEAVTNGGVFKVTDPDDVIIQTGITIPTTGGGNIVFENDQITAKITDGSTDFAAGDKFTIAVTIGAREVVLLDKTATDGSSRPYAVLADDSDASSAAVKAVAYLEGQFNIRALIFASGTDVEDAREEMRDLGMLINPSVNN